MAVPQGPEQFDSLLSNKYDRGKVQDESRAMAQYSVADAPHFVHPRYDGAIAEMPNRNFVYAWSKYRGTGSAGTYEIEYMLLDKSGNTVRSISKLTNLSSATLDTYDELPVIAVALNGRIGVLWYRYGYNDSNSSSNYNIYYAVLDAGCNLVVPPTNLTNNTRWGYG